MRHTHVLLCLGFLACLQSVKGQLLINEVAPNGSLIDASGNEVDWLELYNAGAFPVLLSNYALSDDALHLNKYPLPSVTLAANALFICCSKW